MKIRPATLDDLPSLMAIEQDAYKSPWNERMMRGEVSENTHAHVTVMDYNGIIIGYACFWIIEDEGMLNKLTISRPLQGKKLGQLLLQDTIDRIRSANCQRITLEVRVSNVTAHAVYRKAGFEPIGIRKKYYDDGEDAQVMLLQLREGEAYEEVYCRD